MSYFSRLTDIVTCSLSDILAREADPAVAIGRIIQEMDEGLAGAKRSVATAAANAERIRKELEGHAAQAESWTADAKQKLQEQDDDGARLALARRREIDDLIAGLELQHKAAVATKEHLTTTLHALEARRAEAIRRQQLLNAGESNEAAEIPAVRAAVADVTDSRAEEIERDLEALRRELGQG
jgi:phage shock protein A